MNKGLNWEMTGVLVSTMDRSHTISAKIGRRQTILDEIRICSVNLPPPTDFKTILTNSKIVNGNTSIEPSTNCAMNDIKIIRKTLKHV